jgi:hypothetical protein
MNNCLDFPQLLRASGAALFRPRIVLFVGFFAWYLDEIVNLRLVFEARDELFLCNLRFFTDFTGQPGSLLKWADSLLVQLCYHGWPGAMALAALAWLLLVSTAGFMNATARAPVGGAWVVPGMFLMMLDSTYYLPKSMIVGLTLAMIAANGWVRMPLRRLWLRLAVFVAISIALYYVAGVAYYCFLACCVVHEGLAGKRRLSGALLLLAGAGVKFGVDAALVRLDLASRNYHLPCLDEFRQAPPGRWMVLFFCYFPACAAFVALRQEAARAATTLWRRLRKADGGKAPLKHGKGREQKKAAGPKKPVASAGISGPFRWAAGTVLMLALPAAAGWYTLDRKVKAFLEIDYCVERQLWNELLAKARQLRYYSPSTNHDVNLALYHSGRLPYEMFSYPQHFRILFDQIQVSGVAIAMLRKPCDLLLELGRVNEAEHEALEMLEMCPTARTLKRLAMVKMIKNQPAAASVFLNALRDDLILGHWASECLQRLAADPALAGDEDVQRTRRLMIPEDDLDLTCRIAAGSDITLSYPTMLLDLLKHNDRNRMAFEYLMAMHLLECNVSAAVELFPFLDQMSYPAIPRHYEEAALIYGSDHPRDIAATAAGVFFRGRRISESTLEKYRLLQAIVKRAGGSIERAGPDLARELQGSYFTYYLTHSGKPHE